MSITVGVGVHLLLRKVFILGGGLLFWGNVWVRESGRGLMAFICFCLHFHFDSFQSILVLMMQHFLAFNLLKMV